MSHAHEEISHDRPGIVRVFFFWPLNNGIMSKTLKTSIKQQQKSCTFEEKSINNCNEQLYLFYPCFRQRLNLVIKVNKLRNINVLYLVRVVRRSYAIRMFFFSQNYVKIQIDVINSELQSTSSADLKVISKSRFTRNVLSAQRKLP